MARRSIVVVLGSLGVVALLVVLRAHSLRAVVGPQLAASSIAQHPESNRRTGADTSRSLEPAHVDLEAAPENEVAVVGKTSVTAADDPAFANAKWVEGRVVFPAGTPSDEEVWVVADGRRFADKKLHRAKVDEQGRFRVAFHPRSRWGRLEFDARYLRFAPSTRIDLGAPVSELVLTPGLGGRIVGACRVPSESRDRRGTLVGETVAWAELYTSRSDRRVSARLDHELRFELRAVPPYATGELALYPREFVPIVLKSTRVDPGQTLELAIDLRAGVALAGLVVDDEGRPIADADIVAHNEDVPLSGYREARSAADGTVRVAGLIPGRISIEGTCVGHLATRIETKCATEGRACDELVVRLSRGESVAGTLRWPDGTPASGVEVVAERTGPAAEPFFEPLLPQPTRTATDASGVFRIPGLAHAPYRLRAQAEREPRLTVEPAARHGPTDSRTGGRERFAMAYENVPLGSRSLELVLVPE